MEERPKISEDSVEDGFNEDQTGRTAREGFFKGWSELISKKDTGQEQPSRSEKFREWFHGVLFPRVVMKEDPAQPADEQSGTREQHTDVLSTTKNANEKLNQSRDASGETEKTSAWEEPLSDSELSADTSSDEESVDKATDDKDVSENQNSSYRSSKEFQPDQLAKGLETRTSETEKTVAGTAKQEQQTIKPEQSEFDEDSPERGHEIRDNAISTEKSDKKQESGPSGAHHISEVISDRSRDLKPVEGADRSWSKRLPGSSQTTQAISAGFIAAVVILAVIALMTLIA